MKHNSVYILNSTLRGYVHEIIDSSIIYLCSSIYNSVKVHFFKDRINAIKNDVSSLSSNTQNIVYYSIPKIPIGSTMFAGLWDILILLFGSRKSLYILTSINVASIRAINFLSKLLKKDVVLVAHAELQHIEDVSKKNKWSNSVREFYLNSNLSEHFKIMVLSEGILDRVKEVIPNRSSHFFYFEHPYFVKRDEAREKIFNPNSISIGVIGGVSLSKERGLNNILKLSASISSYQNITLKIVGKVSKEARLLLPQNVEICNNSDTLLSKEEYDALIDTLDYIYLPYPEESFKYTASGAILDAIFKQKAIIMHHNYYVDHICNKYGNFGYILTKENNLELLNSIDNQEFYSMLSSSCEKVSERLSIENIVKEIDNNFFETFL